MSASVCSTLDNMHDLTPTELALLLLYRKVRDKIDDVLNVLRDIKKTVQPVSSVQPAPPVEPSDN